MPSLGTPNKSHIFPIKRSGSQVILWY